MMGEQTTFSERVGERANTLAELGVKSLGALYDLTSRRLVRYAVTLTRNQHDAEDAVQAVLVRVAAHPKLLAAAKCPWSYLLQMVRNEALGIVRRKKRWSLVSNIADLLTRRLVDEVELEDTHRAVWIALRKLPTEQAEVVVLKIWEEATFAEIAEILEISPNTAASRYQYAMQKLSRHLAPIRQEVCHD
jgi:RNA polymerase sigma-70 factor (ECF subfamily)